jgi:hypothetical protein
MRTMIDRPGMHDEYVGIAGVEPFHVEAEERDILADRGEKAAALALVLDAQEHDDIGVGQDRIEIVGDIHAQLAEDFRHQG